MMEFFAPDMHLYRVRKAAKIQKYLVQASTDGYYVVASKLDLSDAVAPREGLRRFYGHNDDKARSGLGSEGFFSGQCARAFAESGDPAREQALTVVQARTLAELSWNAGLTDLSYNNFFFTHDGRVALLDTEPLARSAKKSNASKVAHILLPGDKWLISAQQSLQGIMMLSTTICAGSPQVRDAIQSVERKYFIQSLAAAVAKAAFGCFLFYIAPTAVSLLALKGSSAWMVGKLIVVLGLLNGFSGFSFLRAFYIMHRQIISK